MARSGFIYSDLPVEAFMTVSLILFRETIGGLYWENANVVINGIGYSEYDDIIIVGSLIIDN